MVDTDYRAMANLQWNNFKINLTCIRRSITGENQPSCSGDQACVSVFSDGANEPSSLANPKVSSICGNFDEKNDNLPTVSSLLVSTVEEVVDCQKKVEATRQSIEIVEEFKIEEPETEVFDDPQTRQKKTISFSEPLEFDLEKLYLARIAQKDQKPIEVLNTLNAESSCHETKMLDMDVINEMKGMINEVRTKLNQIQTFVQSAIIESDALSEFLKKITSKVSDIGSKRKLSVVDHSDTVQSKEEPQPPVQLARKRKRGRPRRLKNYVLNFHESSPEFQDNDDDGVHGSFLDRSNSGMAEVNEEPPKETESGKTYNMRLRQARANSVPSENSSVMIKRCRTEPETVNPLPQSPAFILKDWLPKTLQRKEGRCLPHTECFVCHKPCDLLYCGSGECPRGYHPDCLNMKRLPKSSTWVCPWHYCSKCRKRTGVKKCSQCLKSYCSAHRKGNIFLAQDSTYSCKEHLSNGATSTNGDSADKGESVNEDPASASTDPSGNVFTISLIDESDDDIEFEEVPTDSINLINEDDNFLERQNEERMPHLL